MQSCEDRFAVDLTSQAVTRPGFGSLEALKWVSVFGVLDTDSSQIVYFESLALPFGALGQLRLYLVIFL